MKHPIWGPICWKILSRLMHVHKPVCYAKALTTPSWPICSLFIFSIFCLSSISSSPPFFSLLPGSASLITFQLAVSVSVTSTPLERTHANVCTVFVPCAAPRSSSPGPTLFSASPLQFLDGYILAGESAHVLWAEHVLFSIVWRRCAYWMERGKVKETIWLSYGPPLPDKVLVIGGHKNGILLMIP